MIQGMCLSSPAKINGSLAKERLIRLWAHESFRVVSDRFIVEYAFIEEGYVVL